MKDPAFLFYFRDFKSSTEGMSNAARGAYIQLMCLQAENGYITEVDMKKICSNICYDTMQVTIDEKTLSAIKTKFQETAPGSGQFINQRLQEEIAKRLKYSESRRSNRKNKKEETCDQSYEKHMVNGNVNENINENIKGVQGEKIAVEAKNISPQSQSSDDPQTFFTPSTAQFKTEQLFMRHHLPWDQVETIYEQFKAKRIKTGEYLNRRQMWAAWEGYLATYAENERKRQKTQPKTNREKLLNMIR